MDSHVTTALADAVPGRKVDAVASTGPSWNEANRTVRVAFADGDSVYLKVACDGDGSRIARERAVIAHVNAKGTVPVPDVLGSDVDAAVPYLLTAPVAGESLPAVLDEAGEREKVQLARETGRALATVHARRFEDHGHVVGGGADGLELRTAPWTDVLVGTIREMRAIAPAERFDHHFDEVIAAVEANRALLDGAPAALLHGDPAVPNCFRCGDGVGFLDWELAHVGDPARDVYRARAQQFDSLRSDGPQRIVTAFLDGYRGRAGQLPEGYDDRRPVYETVRLLGASGYFERYADFFDEPTEALADWLREEMRRRLATIT